MAISAPHPFVLSPTNAVEIPITSVVYSTTDQVKHICTLLSCTWVRRIMTSPTHPLSNVVFESRPGLNSGLRLNVMMFPGYVMQ